MGLAARAADEAIASGARLGGDGQESRFVLELDKPVAFRVFTLADPYR
ncbi:MAG: N-acetylmuramoyl-L-alanine amidase, partial [Hyphomicrobiales bacterium]